MAKVNPKQQIKRHKVTFSIDLPDAKVVILMGDFNDWNIKRHPMKKDVNGIWTKAVMLPLGRYEYKFMVDGQWKKDPQNDQVCQNCFGTHNSVFDLTIT